MKAEYVYRSPAGFTVRHAGLDDVAAARAHILTVITEDLGRAYTPAWHWDLDDIAGVYLDNPRHALFVAVDDASGALVGTSAIRAEGPKAPPHPQWLAERYPSETTAQLYRVYVNRTHRRRGVAQALVAAARQFAAAEGGYRVIYLHTDAKGPGALAFWTALPATLVHDARPDDPEWNTMHFEIPLR